MADLTKEEFTRRFTDHAIKSAGFTHFDDGVSVAKYCEDVAPSYYSDPAYRDEGPETCADSDMSYWGEE